MSYDIFRTNTERVWRLDDSAWCTFLEDTKNYDWLDWDVASLPAAEIVPHSGVVTPDEVDSGYYFDLKYGSIPCEKEVRRNVYQQKNKPRRPKIEEKKKGPRKFVPHSGENLNSRFLSQLKFMRSQFPSDADRDLIFKRLEDFVLFIGKLSLMRDKRLIALEIITYLKTFCDKSILHIAVNYILGECLEMRRKRSAAYDEIHAACTKKYLDEMILSYDEHFEEVVCDFDCEGGYVDDFVGGLRRVMEDYNVMKGHPVFAKISYILSAFVTLGLCDAARVTWSVGGMKLFSPDLHRKHISANDFVSAILETVVYFVEGGIDFFRHGEVGALLFSDKRVRELQNEFTFLRANFCHVQTGNLERCVGITVNDYSARLDKVIDAFKRIKPLCEKNERTVIGAMEVKLSELRAELQIHRMSGGIRPRPIVICLTGESSIGKSVVQHRLMDELHFSLPGLTPNKDNYAYYDQYDKYDGSIRGNTTGIFFDELGNTKTQFQEKVPYEFVMRANNNPRMTAVMADVELKNKISIEPAIMIITTNDATLGAFDCSKCPVSVLRRVDAFVEMKVRPEFCREGTRMIDPEKVALAYKDDSPDTIQDVWELTLTEIVGQPNPVKGRSDIAIPRPLCDKEGPLTNVGYKRMLKYLIDMSLKIRASQDKLVRDNGNFAESLRACEHCKCLTTICECAPAPMEPHGGIMDVFTKPVTTIARDWAWKTISNKFYDCMRHPYALVAWASPTIYYAHIKAERENKVCIVWERIICHFLIWTFLMLVATQALWIIALVGYVTMWYDYHKSKMVILDEFARFHNDGIAIHNLLARVRERRIAAIISSIGILALVYEMVKWYRMCNNVAKLIPEGNLMPTSYNDIETRDTEKNIWQKVVVESVSKRETVTATPSQVCNTVFKNLLVMVVGEEREKFSNAVAIEKDVILAPAHMIMRDGKPTRALIKFYRHGHDVAGGAFSGYVDEVNCKQVPYTDFVLMSIKSGGSFGSITHLLPDMRSTGSSIFVYKNPDGTRREEGATIKPATCKHTLMEFCGYDTVLTHPSYKGLCMGAYVTTGKGPHVAGWHLGGTSEPSTIGIAGFISHTVYQEVKKDLFSKIFEPHGKGVFPNKILDKDILISENIHQKSPVNFLEDSQCMRVYGSCLGGVTFTSRVVKSLISDAVALYTGVENMWGPPKTDTKWRPWHDTMDKITHPSPGFYESDILWAVEDYSAPLLKIIEENEYARNMIRPLEPHEVINGIPGERFIDKMNFSSAIGFPLTGAKSNFLMDDVPREGYDNPQTFTPEIWKEIERNGKDWAARERSYVPIKAVLKDEPTKIGKNKMRTFYSMGIGLQYHLRRLTLGLTRFIQMHPLICESMVGMNCMSDEWEQWVNYCRQDGFDACFAGDYKSYDTKMPAQLIAAALKMAGTLMRASGNFSEEDMAIFDGICTEMINPVVAFNGTLVEFSAGHISGNNLTVHVNNWCNSLLKRIGFLNIEVRKHESFPYTFRDCEKGGNYGDDCKAAVNTSRVKYWNMKSYAAFLKEHGMEYTMPDKTSEMVEFMKWEDAEFLKRTDSYIPEINCVVGKLDETSIFKSLHSNLKSDVLSPTDHAIACMDGAAFEFFAHGRTVYDTRIAQLQQVAQEMHIRPTGVYKTFDMRVEEWLETYGERRVASTTL